MISGGLDRSPASMAIATNGTDCQIQAALITTSELNPLLNQE